MPTPLNAARYGDLISLGDENRTKGLMKIGMH